MATVAEAYEVGRVLWPVARPVLKKVGIAAAQIGGGFFGYHFLKRLDGEPPQKTGHWYLDGPGAGPGNHGGAPSADPFSPQLTNAGPQAPLHPQTPRHPPPSTPPRPSPGDQAPPVPVPAIPLADHDPWLDPWEETNPWVPGDGAIGDDTHHQMNAAGLAAKNKSKMSKPAFPRTKNVTMRWAGFAGGLTPPGGSHQAGRIIFKANSITNPGSALNGADNHEPLGFTQYAAMYDHYVVNEVRCRWDFYLNEQATAEASNAIDNVCVGITPVNTDIPLTKVGHYQELESSVWTTLSPEQCGRLNFTIKPNTYFGIPDKALRADDTLKGNCNAGGGDPSNMLFLHLWVHTLDLTAEVPSIEGVLTAEFDVTFMEPKALVQS